MLVNNKNMVGHQLQMIQSEFCRLDHLQLVEARVSDH
jgi:hypothetical protein